ncbi:serine hydrolase domain-containing protein [Geomonas sp.]|uniref:serine hydrolase domain-containing protein n=1 Tax=Geomonas sp. TaxID=2651584 RepID=UPI002B4A4444|nr:serine hydrolase domain-containing protein [Geomonas sp.]HJV34072.1 serine hydrolase domain-containing protein [Geomonas sp.]
MTLLSALVCVVLLALATVSFAADSARIDALVDDAISRKLIAGGVVLIGSRDRVVFQRAYGRVSPLPDASPMTTDTIFDLASLTKVLATTPSILKLAEEGRLSLLDPVEKWFPELSGHGKENVLVLNLLTHTSGLDDIPLAKEEPMKSAIQGAALQKLKGEVGSRFRYADLNFILLAELVKRATGAGIDLYSQASFYRPLGMAETSFNPAERLRCSPTLRDEQLVQGEVQDEQARRLGGVAGHAGLFSTAGDLAKFCRMMLSGGVLDGKRVLAQRTVEQMTAPYFARGGEVIRGLGWDISSPYSSPRGLGFSKVSFGHTGYSGSSIWIDPVSDTFVILLTARVDYKNVHQFNQLRAELSTLASVLFTVPPELREMAHLHDQ